MNKKILVSILAVVTLAFVHLAEAQQEAKVPRIGFLTTSGRATSAASVEAFRQGLRELGYVEGKNINIEYRYAEGRFERLPALAKELVRLKVDILLVPSTAAAQPAKKVTATIPIVMVNAGDPIGSGVVASLARPGGSVTGLTTYSPELLGKRLELLKEVVPKVSRFAFLADTTALRSSFKDAQLAAKALGVKFQAVEVKAPNPIHSQGAHWRSSHRSDPTHSFLPKKNFGASGTKSYSCDALGARMGERRWSHVLRGEPS
jgi:putative ABC transport system substrate-binding protein